MLELTLHHEPLDVPLCFIGAGSMGSALISGALRAGLVDPGLVVVADPDARRREAAAALGVRAFEHARDALGQVRKIEAVSASGQIVLAVKPQMLGAVAGELAPLLGHEHRVIISILAGTPTQRVHDVLGHTGSVIRAMPNTPASVGRAMTAVALGSGSIDGDERVAVRIFEGVGRVVRIEESLMDAFTALAGSGPAYVFLLAEAMASAGEQMGFDRETALRAARETVAGAGLLLASSELDPGALRAAVTSRGGTTEAAMRVLESEDVAGRVARAILAARDRGAELAKE